MLARRFLIIVAILIVLVIAGALAYRIFERQLMKFALIPGTEFEGGPPTPPSRYADKAMWIARPDIPNNPSLWAPAGLRPAAVPLATTFFIHPTSYLEKSRWNAPLGDAESQKRARLFVRSQASAFNGVGPVWAPKYRQATFGAFLTTKADSAKALDFAYRDVAAAFDAFLAQAPADKPIILAAHSQGSLHLMRLLAEKVAGKPVAKRIVAAYVIGWPISVKTDLPTLGLPACQSADQAGCILSWQSFADDGDPKMVTEVYDSSASAAGVPRRGTPMLCTNPLGPSGRERNLGTLVPNKDFSNGTLKAPGVAATCDERGFLRLKGDAPDLGPYVLPGGNYHVYDYALFWTNVRMDAGTRVLAYVKR
jgi:hypothetical protein